MEGVWSSSVAAHALCRGGWCQGGESRQGAWGGRIWVCLWARQSGGTDLPTGPPPVPLGSFPEPGLPRLTLPLDRILLVLKAGKAWNGRALLDALHCSCWNMGLG